jgi:hypothetical protein
MALAPLPQNRPDSDDTLIDTLIRLLFDSFARSKDEEPLIFLGIAIVLAIFIVPLLIP